MITITNTDYIVKLPHISMEEWNGIWKKNLVWNGIWNENFSVWNGYGMQEIRQYEIYCQISGMLKSLGTINFIFLLKAKSKGEA